MIDWDGDGNPFGPTDIVLNDVIFNEPQRQAEAARRAAEEEERRRKKRLEEEQNA